MSVVTDEGTTAGLDHPLHRREPPRVLSPSFSGTGVTMALAFFSLSLHPSLLPRPALFQGVVSGVSLMLGYGVGTLGQWLWEYLQIPKPPAGRTRTLVWAVATGLVFVVLTVPAVWRHVGWQNEVRDIFGMPSAPPTVWIIIGLTTIVFGALILIMGRSIRRLYRVVTTWLNGHLPRRPSLLLGGVLLAVAAWWVFSGVLLNGLFTVANQVMSVRDSGTEHGVEQPLSAQRSGSPQSLIPWESLGRQGRTFVAGGATLGELNDFSGGGAVEPVRVYAGLESAPTLQERADLVLADLIRSGGFDRDILVVATTTGTGWIDPRATDPLEYLFNGDTAIVGVQYSYLPSWLSLLADRTEAELTARVVFETIHDYWSTLPEDDRPRIYLFGLSLGSEAVETVLSSISMINAPIDGALLAGPTFLNQLHRRLIANRDPDSPAWLPVVDEGRTVRFTTEDNALDDPTGPWGPTRIAYLQHPTDPIVYFSPSLAIKRPDWLRRGERSPDLPTRMSWVPFVTMSQVAIDIAVSDTVPIGYGHRYSPAAYIDCWMAITDTTRTPEEVAALKALFANTEWRH